MYRTWGYVLQDKSERLGVCDICLSDGCEGLRSEADSNLKAVLNEKQHTLENTTQK